jgi:hypothetical protein
MRFPAVRSPVLRSPVLRSPVLRSPVLRSPVLRSPVLGSPVLGSPVPAGQDQDSGRQLAGVQALRGAGQLDARRAGGPHRGAGRIIAGGGEQHGVPVHAEHLADLKAVGGDDLEGTGRAGFSQAEQQPPSTAGVGRPHNPAIGQGGRHARHHVDPRRVGVGPDHRGDATDRVGGEQPHLALVAAEDHDERGVVPGPAGLGQVREGQVIGVERGHLALGRDDEEGDDRVRGPGGRIAHAGRRRARVGRIGDVPHLHRVLIDPRDEQR